MRALAAEVAPGAPSPGAAWLTPLEGSWIEEQQTTEGDCPRYWHLPFGSNGRIKSPVGFQKPKGSMLPQMRSGGCSTRMFDGGSSLVNMLIVAQGLAHVTSLIHSDSLDRFRTFDLRLARHCATGLMNRLRLLLLRN